MARVEPVPPHALDGQQRALFEEMTPLIAEHLQSFVSRREDGALVGPFAPMHEVDILVTGAALGARYELYAHQQVAAQTSLSASKIATVAAGERPADLTLEEEVAYDIAASLMRGGALPQSTFDAAVDALGQDGMAELVFLVGGYSLVSMLLNAYDVPVPGVGDGAPV